VLAPANRHDSPLLAPTLDKLDDLGPCNSHRFVSTH
jgi:hypothetical protein